MRRVGNDTDIRIWDDKWLPTALTHKVISPRLFLHSDTRVCELINSDSASWNLAVIDALFYLHEAEVIKGLPLSSRLPTDKLIWVASPNGFFSVRSAYTLAMKLSQPENNGTSSDNWQVRRFWRKFWSLPVTPKLGTLPGEPVEIFCPESPTSGDARCCKIAYVMNAG